MKFGTKWLQLVWHQHHQAWENPVVLIDCLRRWMIWELGTIKYVIRCVNSQYNIIFLGGILLLLRHCCLQHAPSCRKWKPKQESCIFHTQKYKQSKNVNAFYLRKLLKKIRDPSIEHHKSNGKPIIASVIPRLKTEKIKLKLKFPNKRS